MDPLRLHRLLWSVSQLENKTPAFITMSDAAQAQKDGLVLKEGATFKLTKAGRDKLALLNAEREKKGG